VAHELDWAWIVIRVAGIEGNELSYAALCLSPAFKQSVRTALAGWDAAAELMENKGFSLVLHDNEVMWLSGDPDNWENWLAGDAYDWVRVASSNLLEELTCTPEEVAESKLHLLESTCERTEYEKMHITGGANPYVHFSCYEKHGCDETTSGCLPPWVISWVFDEDESDNNNNTEVHDGE